MDGRVSLEGRASDGEMAMASDNGGSVPTRDKPGDESSNSDASTSVYFCVCRGVG